MAASYLNGVRHKIKQLVKDIICFILFAGWFQTAGTAAPITRRTWFIQKILGFNRSAYWPTHHSSVITNPANILIGMRRFKSPCPRMVWWLSDGGGELLSWCDREMERGLRMLGAPAGGILERDGRRICG